MIYLNTLDLLKVAKHENIYLKPKANVYTVRYRGKIVHGRFVPRNVTETEEKRVLNAVRHGLIRRGGGGSFLL